MGLEPCSHAAELPSGCPTSAINAAWTRPSHLGTGTPSLSSLYVKEFFFIVVCSIFMSNLSTSSYCTPASGTGWDRDRGHPVATQPGAGEGPVTAGLWEGGNEEGGGDRGEGEGRRTGERRWGGEGRLGQKLDRLPVWPKPESGERGKDLPWRS